MSYSGSENMHASSRQPRKWTVAEDQKLREEVEAQMIESGEVKDWCRIAIQLPGRTNKDCRKRWHNSVAGGLKKGQWSKSEDSLLARAVQQYGQKWTMVATCVESRSADQCAKRWQQSLDPELDRSEWREDEDNTLMEATQQLGRHWKDIQQNYFPGRSKNCIKNRYTVLVRRYQIKGPTLPSRGTSPCETPSPFPEYAYDEEIASYPHQLYGNMLTPPTQGRPGARPHSWSSINSEPPSAWSSSQDYGMTYSAPSASFHHATSSMQQPTYSQSPPAGTYPNPVPQVYWPTMPVDPSPSLHSNTHPSYRRSAATPSAPPHYDDSTSVRPVMSPSRSYSTSAMPNQAHVSVPRTRAWTEQQHYDSLSPTVYPGYRLQHPDSMYQL